MNKYELKAKTYLATANDSKVQEIADKLGIVLPSEDLAIFLSVYAPLEEANLNGVRLAKDAVEKSLSTLRGKLADVDHIRPYVIGSILDGWINENSEIVIAFTMYKSVFVDEYAKALELMNEGTLSVSFELTTNPDTIEAMTDNTIKLHDINFSGVGLLLSTKPAYPKAKIYEMANRFLNKVKETNLVLASQIAEELGSNIVSEIEKVVVVEEMDAAKWTTKYINSLPDSSFAIIEPDYKNNVSSDKNCRHLPIKDADGNIDLPHLRNALARVNQIKPVTKSISTEELRSKAAIVLESYKHLLKTAQEENISNSERKETKVMELTDEQKAKIEAIKAQLGDKVKDWKDEDFFNEAKLVEAGYVQVKEETSVETVIVDDKTNSVTVKEDEKCVVTTTQDDGTKSVDTSEKTETRTFTQDQVREQIQPYATKAADLQSELEALKAEYEIAKNRIKELEDANTAREAAIVKAEADAKLASIKDSLKDNPYTKEFKDEDFLNVEKVEKAKLQKENDDLKAKLASKPTQEVVASEETPLVTGHVENIAPESTDARSIINKLGKD